MPRRVSVLLTALSMAASLGHFNNAAAQDGPPETTILSAPPSSSIAETADFVFRSSEIGSTFACSLDGADFAPCTSPASYTGLANGSHTFEVRATGPIGGTDPTPAADAWTIAVRGPFKVLHYFDDFVQAWPVTIIRGHDERLYGTTAVDGPLGGGTLFTIDPSGVFQVLHAFSLDSSPNPDVVSPRLVHGTDGNFYGNSPLSGYLNSPQGGFGSIFRVDPFGNADTVVQFYDSGHTRPDGLIQASDAACPALPPAVCLYGTTFDGINNFFGSIYRITNGSLEFLHTFDPYTEGYLPIGALLEGPDGNIYGTTIGSPIGQNSPVSAGGTVYRITPAGDLTVLHTFDAATEGSAPARGLVRGNDGWFYGTTVNQANDPFHIGMIYRIDETGAFQTVHVFGGQPSDGRFPTGELVRGTDGNLYGVTFYGGVYDAGTLYRLDNSGAVKILFSFGGTTSSFPYGLTQGADGALYGILGGGIVRGAIWRFDLDAFARGPLFTSAAATTFAIGSAGSFTVSTTGDPAAALTYTGSLPSGVSLVDNGNGTATLSGTPNAFTVGTYPITIIASNGVGFDATQSFTLVVEEQSPQPQTITVTQEAPASAAFGTSFTVAATATSGLAVAYSSGNPSVCTNSGATFTMVRGSGACIVQYDQPGDADYDSAPQVTSTTTAAKASQTITVTQEAPASAAFGTSFTVAGTASSGLGVAYSSGTPSVCTNSAATFTMVSSSGTCLVQYDQPGDADYSAAPSITVTVIITAATQPPVARTGVVTTVVNTPVSASLQATSPGGLPLTFALTTNGTKGTAVVTDATTGAFTYTPQSGQSGYDAITFTATDANGTSAAATEMVFIVASLTGPTSRVSVASGRTQANNASYDPALSADGRFVAFYSAASDLVVGDTNVAFDVFVHDRQTVETTRVSVASDGTQANGASDQAAISADGRYVIFRSYATNLVPNDTNQQSDVFVHDRVTGETTRVSAGSGGVQANNASDQPALSADGRYVAFHSFATNLVAGDTNGADDVFVHDRITGQTTRVDVASDGAQAIAGSYGSAISADGRIVAFYSSSSNLVASDTNRTYDVFVHDRQTGETSRVSVASDGTQGNAYSLKPALSADGRYVAFYSLASNLVSGDTNNTLDIFAHDRATGQTTRASVASDGTQAAGPSDQPALSADGRIVAYRSWASNLVAGDTNGTFDIFAHDRLTHETTRVSVAGDGTQANSESAVPTVNADGRTLAFHSSATNFVPGDTNRVLDVFVVNVSLGSPNQPPAITSANATTFTVGQAGSFAITTTGFPAVSSILGSGGLPAGVTFVDNGNDTATLAGTPAAGTGGIYLLTITASNGVAPDAVQSFTLTVSEASAAVPQPPANLIAISPQLGSITLTWTDNSTDETAFEIAEDDSLAVVRSVADVTTAAFSGLDAGVSYHWYVRAVNANGASAWFGPVEKIPDGSDGDGAVLPTITVIAPIEPIYQRGSSLTAQYTCTNAVTCVGDIANGAPIDTSVPGLKSFRITATDAAGNSTTVLVTFTVSLGACVTALPGMTAWLPGDGSSTDPTTQLQGIWNGAQTYTTGEVAQAFAFANGSFVSLPFQQAGPFTLQAWVRTADRLQPEFTGIVSTGLPEQHSTSLQIELDGLGSYRLNVGNGEQSWLIGPATDFFQHIAVTFDGSTIAAYLNGQLVQSDASTSTELGFQILNVAIDRDGALPFNGAIDEVQVFNRALTPDEVRLSFEAGADGFCKNHPPTAVAAASPNPAEATGPTGATVTLDASSSSDPDGDTLTYAWREGTVPLATGRTSSLLLALGSHTITLTVVDPYGSTSSSEVVVVVRDTTPPVLDAVPPDLIVEASASFGAVASWPSPAAVDIVDGSVGVTCTPASGSTFALGVTAVDCSASDARGNSSSATFHVTVRDTTGPTLFLPADIAAEATSAAGAPVVWSAAASDAVDGAVIVACSPPPGSTFAIGETPVSCSATDAHGNTTTAGFRITVRDTAPPVLALPTQLVVEVTSQLGAAASYTATAVDAVSGPTPVSCVPASGSGFALGTTFVNCAATDAAGNSASGAFPVIVRDTAAPTVQITSPSRDVLLSASSVDVIVQATDVVGVTAVSVNGVAATLRTGTPQAGTWRATVPISLPVAPGGVLQFGARADDGGGNAAAGTLLVDNDGIPSAMDRGRTDGADLSGRYSNDFNNGTTSGTLIRNGWTIKLSNAPTAGGVRASASGTGSVGRILACGGTAKEVRLDVIGETADIACNPATGTITVKAVSAVPQIELRHQLASGVWQQFNLLTGQSMSVGSPATASAENTAAIAAQLLQIDDAGRETVVGVYELLPGSSVDVAVIEARTGAGGEMQFIVLRGEVRITVNGVERKLRPNVPARIPIPPPRRGR